MEDGCGCPTALAAVLRSLSSSHAPTRVPLPRRWPMPERVLVVDDDPQMLKAVRNALTARGYEVLPAGSGETALTMAADEDLDLVLLDLGLPGMGGQDV